MLNKSALGPSFIKHLWKTKMASLHSPYIIWYDKTTGQKKIRLHLFNHEYSNMNIPYINENLFALLLCKTKYTYLLNV